MKKLLMGSICLTIFSVSILIFQVSCKKEAIAQSPGSSSYVLPVATNNSLGGIIVGNNLSINSTGSLSVNSNINSINKIIFERSPTNSSTAYTSEIWTANYDGSSQSKLNIILPNGLVNAGSPKLSPNGQTIFFDVTNTYSVSIPVKYYIYSCKLDGTNVQLVIDGSSLNNTSTHIAGAY